MAHRHRDEHRSGRRWHSGSRRWDEDRSRQQHAVPGDDGQYGRSYDRPERQGRGYRMAVEDDYSPYSHSYDEDRYRWQRGDEGHGGGRLHGEGYGGGYPDDDGSSPRMRRRGYERHGHEGPYDRDGGRDWWDRASDELSSWFGDEAAERRRRIDREHSFRGRGPRGYTRSDERIREDINDRLTDDWRLDASDIEVTVQGCEVTLNGTVNSRYDKRVAEDIAEDVSGVRHVQNNLRVRQPSPAADL